MKRSMTSSRINKAPPRIPNQKIIAEKTKARSNPGLSSILRDKEQVSQVRTSANAAPS